MEEKYEIEIPQYLTEPLLRIAAETEQSLEDVVDAALRNYMERSRNNA